MNNKQAKKLFLRLKKVEEKIKQKKEEKQYENTMENNKQRTLSIRELKTWGAAP